MTDAAHPHPIGICSWLFRPLPLADTLARIAALGADGVELYGDVERYAPDEVRALTTRYRLEVFSITPADVDLAHPDPAVRGPALAYYRRLILWAAELGRPRISVHGLVGRLAPLEPGPAGYLRERALLDEAVAEICDAAAEHGLQVVFEVLNRYESCFVTTAKQARALLARVGRDNLGVLLDAFHMNIDEADPAAALLATGSQLGLYHLADSNRRGVGQGHSDIPAQLAALRRCGYRGPIILECTTEGLTPEEIPDEAARIAALEGFLGASVSRLRQEWGGG